MANRRPGAQVIVGLCLTMLGSAHTEDAATLSAQLGPVVQRETVEIRGTVLLSPSRSVVPGARVELRRIQKGAAPLQQANVVAEYGAEADEYGQFVFENVDPGDYELEPYFPDGTSPDALRSVKTLSLTNEGPPVVTELWLTPLSKVSGWVLGSDGEPASEMRVQLARTVWDGGLRLEAVPGARAAITDENGAFELKTPAGEYLVAVLPPRGQSGASPIYYYYPNAIYPEDAIRISVQTEASLTGITVSLPRSSLLRTRFQMAIREDLFGGTGLASEYVEESRLLEAWLSPRGRGQIRRNAYRVDLEFLGDDTWETPPLQEGEYDLLVTYSAAVADALRSVGGVDFDWDRLTPISVVYMNLDQRNDTDLDGIVDLGVLPVSPKQSIQGRVSILGQTEDMDLASFVVGFQDTVFRGWGGYADVDDGGTFEVGGLHPGLYRLSPLVLNWKLPPGYYIASVSSGGDVLKDGLLVGGAANPVNIVLAADGATVQGVVRNRDSAVVADARVVLIPPSERRGVFARFLTTVTDAAGTFTFSAVPPGLYRLIALDVTGRTEPRPLGGETVSYWEAPDFVEDVEGQGMRLDVRRGSLGPISVQAIPLQP